MSYEDDDELLASLGRAIGPDPDARPSVAERDALRAVVLRAAAGEPLEPAADEPVADVVPITSARRLRNRLLVGGAAVVIGLSGATAVAAAVNDGALPSPVRAVVHAVGLPVDSIELAQAKDALKRLRTATDAELGDALARAERELADLTPAERASLGDDADRTLAEARVRLARVQAPVTTPTTPPSSAPSTPPSATTPGVTPPSSSPTSTPTSVDDRGGRGGDDSTATSDDRGRGSDDSTATSDDRGGSGGGGHGGGSDDSSPDSTSTGGTTATSDDSGSGKNRGGDTTAATTSSESTTATTDDSGSGKNRGGGSDG